MVPCVECYWYSRYLCNSSPYLLWTAISKRFLLFSHLMMIDESISSSTPATTHRTLVLIFTDIRYSTLYNDQTQILGHHIKHYSITKTTSELLQNIFLQMWYSFSWLDCSFIFFWELKLSKGCSLSSFHYFLSDSEDSLSTNWLILSWKKGDRKSIWRNISNRDQIEIDVSNKKSEKI